jgi:hypothetical protein
MSSPSDEGLPGGCDCGALDDAVQPAPICLCGSSPRTSGSAFKTCAEIRLDTLAATRGDDQTNTTQCATRRSLLWSVVHRGRWIHLARGTPVEAPGIRPMSHIFARGKASWHRTTDDLLQHQECWT